MQLVVAKFGGTSVADYSAMLNCAHIIRQNPQIKLVVLSASAKVTNLLIELGKSCTEQQRAQYIAQLSKIQFNIIDQLKQQNLIKTQIQELINQVKTLSIAANVASSLALTDAIVCYGEIMSTLIFNQVLLEQEQNTSWLDVRNILITNSNFGKAIPDEAATKLNAINNLKPLIEQNKIVITQGFIGRDPDGKTTTLGRGGSDYSAAILAQLLDANELLIWTDVAGVYTTDPRIVNKAHKIDSISFYEASEMATFGAKVLHPATLYPAIKSNIPVFVGSSKAPELGGTWITQEPENRPLFRALALRRNQTLLTISSMNMLHAHGFMAKVFNLLAEYKISVDLITTSEVSIALTLDKTGSELIENEIIPSLLLAELSKIGRVELSTDLALITIIGNNLHTTKGVGKKLSTIFDSFSVRMISYGASSNNMCLLTQDVDADTIITELHSSLFEK